MNGYCFLPPSVVGFLHSFVVLITLLISFVGGECRLVALYSFP